LKINGSTEFRRLNIMNVFLFLIFLIFQSAVYAENRFFYSEYENLLERMSGSGTLKNKMYLDAVKQQKIEQDWTYPELPKDFYTHQIPEINYAPLEEGLLRMAYSHYEKSIDTMDQMRLDLTGIDRKIKSLPEGVWWKVIDEADHLYRKRNRLKMKYAVSLAGTSGKAIEILEGIQNSRVRESRAYRTLYYQSLRMFSIYEVIMGNYDIAFGALMKYRYNPDSDNEWPYHHLLSRCYRYKFLVAQKNTGIEEKDLVLLRKMKNIHYMIAVTLKYGVSSEELKVIKEKIFLEELGSPRNREKY